MANNIKVKLIPIPQRREVKAEIPLYRDERFLTAIAAMHSIGAGGMQVPGKIVAVAKCHPDDEYVESYGASIARSRALAKYHRLMGRLAEKLAENAKTKLLVTLSLAAIHEEEMRAAEKRLALFLSLISKPDDPVDDVKRMGAGSADDLALKTIALGSTRLGIVNGTIEHAAMAHLLSGLLSYVALSQSYGGERSILGLKGCLHEEAALAVSGSALRLPAGDPAKERLGAFTDLASPKLQKATRETLGRILEAVFPSQGEQAGTAKADERKKHGETGESIGEIFCAMPSPPAAEQKADEPPIAAAPAKESGDSISEIFCAMPLPPVAEQKPEAPPIAASPAKQESAEEAGRDGAYAPQAATAADAGLFCATQEGSPFATTAPCSPAAAEQEGAGEAGSGKQSKSLLGKLFGKKK
jgi:hypothetical protein